MELLKKKLHTDDDSKYEYMTCGPFSGIFQFDYFLN